MSTICVSVRRSITSSAATMIMAGATPTRTSLKAKDAPAGATAMSAAATRPMPPARACPFTRAMTGTGLSTMVVRISGIRFGAAEPRSARSAPEQNTEPAPVSTMARTSTSATAPHSAAANSSSMADESAFRLCGESRTSVQMPWSCSTLTSASLMGAV